MPSAPKHSAQIRLPARSPGYSHHIPGPRPTLRISAEHFKKISDSTTTAAVGSGAGGKQEGQVALAPQLGSRPGEGPWAWWGSALPQRGEGAAALAGQKQKRAESPSPARGEARPPQSHRPPPRPPCRCREEGARGQIARDRQAGRGTAAERSRRPTDRSGGKPHAPRMPRHDLTGRYGVPGAPPARTPTATARPAADAGQRRSRLRLLPPHHHLRSRLGHKMEPERRGTPPRARPRREKGDTGGGSRRTAPAKTTSCRLPGRAAASLARPLRFPSRAAPAPPVAQRGERPVAGPGGCRPPLPGPRGGVAAAAPGLGEGDGHFIRACSGTGYQSLAGARHKPPVRPWLAPSANRLFGWTENGCEGTSPSAEPRFPQPGCPPSAPPPRHARRLFRSLCSLPPPARPGPAQPCPSALCGRRRPAWGAAGLAVPAPRATGPRSWAEVKALVGVRLLVPLPVPRLSCCGAQGSSCLRSGVGAALPPGCGKGNPGTGERRREWPSLLCCAVLCSAGRVPVLSPSHFSSRDLLSVGQSLLLWRVRSCPTPASRFISREENTLHPPVTSWVSHRLRRKRLVKTYRSMKEEDGPWALVPTNLGTKPRVRGSAVLRCPFPLQK